jgi:hypothetical protein
MSDLIELTDGDETFYFTHEEILAGLKKAKLSLGSHLLDLRVLRAYQRENDELHAKIDAVWKYIEDNNDSVYYTHIDGVAKALGAKRVVDGKWVRDE